MAGARANYGDEMSTKEGSARPIERVGFDRFSFDAPDVRGDGAVCQRGINSGGMVVVVGSVAWPEMPTDWLAMSSRRGDDLLDLDVDVVPVVDPDLAERFVIDSDDDDLTGLLDETVGTWLITTDDDIGPIHFVLDGPDPDDDATPTLFIALIERDGNDHVDVRDLARSARAIFD